MKKIVLVVGIILLFVGVAMAPSIHFNSVTASNDKRENEINQKDLLIQTILDIANNGEIQKIIFKSQISKEGFFNPDAKVSIFNTPVVTKNQLKQMYLVGLMLSKIISQSRMHSMVEQYRLNNQVLQKEISAVIEKDSILKAEITLLSNLQCDCENISGVTGWSFPVICSVLGAIVLFFLILDLEIHIGDNISIIAFTLGQTLNCWP